MAEAKPKKLSLAAKLLEIRKEVLYLKKDAKGGGGGFTYKYVKGVDVLAAIKPKMDELGLLLIPQILKARTAVVHGKRWDKYKNQEVPDTQYLVDMDILMVWQDVESGETLEVPFFAMANMDDAAKSVGSALTYTERHFLCKFFQVELDELDPDAYQRKKGEAAGPSTGDLEAAGKTAIKSLSADTLKELLVMVDGFTAVPKVKNWARKYRPLAAVALHPEHGTQLWAAVRGKIDTIQAAENAPCPADGAFNEPTGPAPGGPDDEPKDGFPF